MGFGPRLVLAKNLFESKVRMGQKLVWVKSGLVQNEFGSKMSR